MNSGRELMALKFDKSPSIIHEGVLNNNSILVIGGPPKSYKSFLAKTIAKDLAIGANLFGAYRIRSSARLPAFIVSRPVRVLYLEQEIGTESLQARVIKIAAGLNGTQDAFLDNFFCHSTDRDLRLDTNDGIARIGQLIEKSKAEVVIFDPLIEFHSADENSAHEMANVMHGLDALRAHYQIAIILVHHSAKPSVGRYGPDNLRGSSILYGKVDSVLMVDVHNKASGILKVSPTLRRDKPVKPFLIQMDWVNLTYRFYDWYNQKSSDRAQKETLLGEENE